jgi:hypothetical protein
MFVFDDPIDLSELIVRIPYRGRMNLSFWNAITRVADAINPDLRSVTGQKDFNFLPANGGLQSLSLSMLREVTPKLIFCWLRDILNRIWKSNSCYKMKKPTRRIFILGRL